MKKICLITGATSGIGEATAYKFAEAGFDLILTGRREDRLEKLKNKLHEQYQIDIVCLCFDIQDSHAVKENIDNLEPRWKKIAVLVNNAGLASGLAPIQEGDLNDWEVMIDTNLKGLLYVTRAITPLMIAQNKGHIINVASTAAKGVYPGGNVYCATKHAVDALTKAMRIDLHTYGIKVGQICPGATETEFSLVRFHGDPTQASKVYAGYKALSAEDIANSIIYMAQQPDHVNICDLLIMPTAQASTMIFDKKDQ